MKSKQNLTPLSNSIILQKLSSAIKHPLPLRQARFVRSFDSFLNKAVRRTTTMFNKFPIGKVANLS